MKNSIRLSKSVIGTDEIQAVTKVLKKEFLGMGEEVFEFEKEISKHKLIKNLKFQINLFNEKDVIHKLSHQHLHTKFWIIETDPITEKAISAENLKDYPVPALISEFINKFKF